MPKAEVGSTKFLSNKLKSKGLQRLRWYCQVCERQFRDANAFKLHTQSESHVRQMLIVAEDPTKHINEYSKQFLDDFISLLRTAHGEKKVQINHFYQEYIHNKEHVHMNATKWSSLTEVAKHLGKEGICRVEETEKGIQISWVDDSPEALRRQEALRRKELQDKGDEVREQMMISEQIKRAQQAKQRTLRAGDGGERYEDGDEEEGYELRRQDGESIKLALGGLLKKEEKKPSSGPGPENTTPTDNPLPGEARTDELGEKRDGSSEAARTAEKPLAAPLSLKMAAKPQQKNVFAQAKKNALAGGPKKVMAEQPKKMSEAERIMREEMERKRRFENKPFGGAGPSKKQRTQ